MRIESVISTAARSLKQTSFLPYLSASSDPWNRLTAAALKERETATSRSQTHALTRNAALPANLSEQSVELERLRALFSIHSLTKVDDSSWLGLVLMHDLKIHGIQIQTDALSDLLRIKRTDKLGWNGEQPTRSAFLCINRLVSEHCAENGRLRS